MNVTLPFWESFFSHAPSLTYTPDLDTLFTKLKHKIPLTLPCWKDSSQLSRQDSSTSQNSELSSQGSSEPSLVPQFLGTLLLASLKVIFCYFVKCYAMCCAKVLWELTWIQYLAHKHLVSRQSHHQQLSLQRTQHHLNSALLEPSPENSVQEIIRIQ